MKHSIISLLASSILALSAFAVQADESVTIKIKDHKFNPAEVTIPANTKVKFIIENLDPTPEEFESYELHREKIIQGNSKGVVFIGPLKPGKYAFFGEFNMATAQGHIIVK
ncbi:MAG: cupredoxin domain-containing protein [Gammaproteobacteria bacterium]|nr:cupredoxin domain-containing protein [Gammaproteobacteria bacterium]